MYDMVSKALGSKVHQYGQEEDSKGGAFIFMTLPQRLSSHIPHKMAEYREKATRPPDSDNDEEQPIEESCANPEVQPMFMSLASQFLVEDKVNFEEPGNNKQMIDQEYQAYMTAPLSWMSILRFWEVGTVLSNFVHDGNGLPPYPSIRCSL